MSNTEPATFVPTIPAEERAYDYAVMDVVRREAAGGQWAGGLCRRARTDHWRDAVDCTRDQPERNHLHPARAHDIERERGVQVRIFTCARNWSSPAIPRLAPRTGFMATTPFCAEQARSYSTCALVPSSEFLRATGWSGVFCTMLQNDPSFGRDPRSIRGCAGARLASATSILPCPSRPSPPAWPSASLRCDRWRWPRVLRFRSRRHRSTLPRSDAKFFYCTTRADGRSGADWHARMQFYNGEDPLPARPPAAPSPIWFAMACRKQSADRLRTGHRDASPQPHLRPGSKRRSSHSGCARGRAHHSHCKRTPFLPRCTEFQQTQMRIANRDALFEISVNAQANFPRYSSSIRSCQVG